MAFLWAAAICTALPKPPTPGNIRGLNAWIACEGGTGHNNPMNTKQSGFGGTNFNSVGVKRYPTPANGVAATVATLRNGYYPDVLAAMNRLGGLAAGILHDPAVASNISKWGTSVSCIRGRLGGASSSSKSSTTPSVGAMGFPGSGVVGGITGTAKFLANLPHYLEIAGGGVVLVFGALVAIYGSSGSHIIGRTVKKAALAAAVA